MSLLASLKRLGATPVDARRTEFVVWAPLCKSVDIEIVAPVQQRVTLKGDAHGYFSGIADVAAGARYWVLSNGKERRPDPASRYQPDGVHGVSQVVDPAFAWTDTGWHGVPQRDYIIYELHVGTFTAAGTFDGVTRNLDYLSDLGITAVEIMPVAQFPGARNWGYDGVLPYAVQNSYGGPDALKRMVNACHARGMAVLLDVVYNHLGPEGNYLGEFAPYFTTKYHTPWGPSINVDGEHSDGVRHYFIANALEWIQDYHFDGLRLDAVHGILDTSAIPFLGELSSALHDRGRALDREIVVIAESDLNDVRMIQPVEAGGLGMDAQWMDDFHHSLHSLLTREDAGYYADYGELGHFATSLERGYVYAGDYSSYRKRRHGNAPEGARPEQFVVCVQNHDQVGNRMLGERIASLVDVERVKLGAACVLLAPFLPMLFMGEEYGEKKPFPYFIHHSDDKLIAAVRKGRKHEFSAFSWKGEPPDPQSADTFASAILDPAGIDAQQQALLAVYRRLIELRKRYRLGPGETEQRDVITLEAGNIIVVQRLESVVVFAFADEKRSVELPLPRGDWQLVFSTSDCLKPASLTSPGSVRLDIPATSATLFVADQESR